ncbi:MAG: hypothetical protein GXP13_03845 [Gammaproteobacteria bacterium]|nr:hypothetical protein [Gammaproteobacteria bacterium]
MTKAAKRLQELDPGLFNSIPSTNDLASSLMNEEKTSNILIIHQSTLSKSKNIWMINQLLTNEI